MTMSRLALAILALLPLALAAQTRTQPLPQDGHAPAPASAQGSQTGITTFGNPGEQQVIVRSYEPDAVLRDQYRIVFDALDTNGDGYLDRAEAAAHPTLAAEFGGVDTDTDGRLSKEELRGWIQ
ncbi:EF-hand domain-containing protein [Luteimonas yindakuii]|nr:EF-hand domain-containing protein [Luteimonas yindakuii]